MISRNMQEVISDQVNKELASAYLYLAMAGWLESQNFPGGAHWMHVQYKEELGHAEKLLKFVHDRNGRIVLNGIDKPQSDFGSLADTFKAVLAHEQKVTASIEHVYEAALAEKDYAAQIELQWFIKEQVEEEKTVLDILHQLEACDGRPHLMLMIDRHLARRGA